MRQVRFIITEYIGYVHGAGIDIEVHIQALIDETRSRAIPLLTGLFLII